MPRKRRKPRVMKMPIDPAEIFVLQHGTSGGGPPHEHLKIEFFMRKTDGWRNVWEEVRKEVMAAWIKKSPGTRPWGWWEFDAPRWEKKFDAWYDGKKPKPRRRLGGIGTPEYEVLAYVPYFDKGLPMGWVTKFDEEYYNGRAKDIHGNPIGLEHYEGDFAGVAIDPDNPPQFESEAAYLERLGLLTPGEKKWLETHPEALEPETVEFED